MRRASRTARSATARTSSGLNADKCVTCHAGVKSAEEIRITKDDLDGDKDVKEGVAGELATMQEKLFATIQAYAKDVVKNAHRLQPGQPTRTSSSTPTPTARRTRTR